MVQADFFISVVTETPTITQERDLVLVPPSMHPKGAEAVERKLARLREIEDRRREKAEKKGMVYA